MKRLTNEKEWQDYLTPHINSKLKESGIKKGDHSGAIKALAPCVLGGRMIAVYRAINNLDKGGQ